MFTSMYVYCMYTMGSMLSSCLLSCQKLNPKDWDLQNIWFFLTNLLTCGHTGFFKKKQPCPPDKLLTVVAPSNPHFKVATEKGWTYLTWMAVFSEGRWGQPERNNFEVGGHGGIPRLNLQFYRMAVFYEEPGIIWTGAGSGSSWDVMFNSLPAQPQCRSLAFHDPKSLRRGQRIGFEGFDDA